MNENNDKLKFGWIATNSYNVVLVIIGLLFLIGSLYVYLNYYINFPEKQNLGIILTVTFIVGFFMSINGLSSWRRMHKKREKVEEMKLKVQYEENKKRLKQLKDKNKYYVA